MILTVISSIDGISSVDITTLSPLSQTSTSLSDYVIAVSNRVVALERRLKALEHVSILTLCSCCKYMYIVHVPVPVYKPLQVTCQRK